MGSTLLPASTQPTLRCIESLPALEHECGEGLLAGWDNLVRGDPSATVFQSPGWCREWYRCYANEFAPLVLCVMDGERLVGLVPLAVERVTGAMVFAGNEWSDYRDVVAAPGYRRDVLAELLRVGAERGLRRPLHVGPTQPHSETVELLAELLPRARGVYGNRYSSPTWWVDLRDEAAIREITRKQSVRRNVNYYKRQGDLRYTDAIGPEEWRAIRAEFFAHHTLRQVVTDRVLSFADPRKQAFFDALVEKGQIARICTLRLEDRVIAAHYGYLWDDVLHWGAPVFDILEERNSPGQVLLAMLIQASHEAGLSALDLTLGNESFKARFSTARVDLPSVTLYSRFIQFRRQRLRGEVSRGVKRAALRLGGSDLLSRIAAARERLVRRVRMAAMGPSLGGVGARLQRLAGERRRVVVLRADSGSLLSAGEHGAEPHAEAVIGRNDLRDLLRAPHAPNQLNPQIRSAIAEAPRRIAAGHILHTFVIDGRLRGWGWSQRLEDPVPVPGTGTTLRADPEAVLLSGPCVLPDSGVLGLHGAFAEAAAREWAGAGVARLYVCCGEDNPSRGPMEAVGFCRVEIHELSRQIWRSRTRRTVLDPSRAATPPSAASALPS